MISSRSVALKPNSTTPGILDFASTITVPLKITADDNLIVNVVANPDLSGLPIPPNSWLNQAYKKRYNIEVSLKKPIVGAKTYNFTITLKHFVIPVKVVVKP